MIAIGLFEETGCSESCLWIQVAQHNHDDYMDLPRAAVSITSPAALPV